MTCDLTINSANAITVCHDNMLAHSWLRFTLSMQDFIKLRLKLSPTIFRDVTPCRLV
jgi:hypothetical protein